MQLQRELEYTRILSALPQGLTNSSNACSLNACLQALSGLFLLLRPYSHPEFQSLLEALTLCSCFDVSERVARSIRQVASPLNHFGLSLHSQNDAHETMLQLLDRCFKPKSDHLPFLGKITISRNCTKCGNTATSVESFTVLTVKPDCLTISGCLKNLAQPRHVENVECGHCKAQTLHAFSETISDLPDLLIIHIDRVSLDSKSQQPVFIDSKLAVTNSRVYELSSVIYHIGSSAHSGHYATLRRWDRSIFGFSSSPRWITVDDDKVNYESEAFPGTQLVRENAYLVCFTKI